MKDSDKSDINLLGAFQFLRKHLDISLLFFVGSRQRISPWIIFSRYECLPLRRFFLSRRMRCHSVFGFAFRFLFRDRTAYGYIFGRLMFCVLLPLSVLQPNSKERDVFALLSFFLPSRCTADLFSISAQWSSPVFTLPLNSRSPIPSHFPQQTLGQSRATTLRHIPNTCVVQCVVASVPASTLVISHSHALGDERCRPVPLSMYENTSLVPSSTETLPN